MPWIDPDEHGYGFGVACPWCWLREVLRWFTVAGQITKHLVKAAFSLIARGFKQLTKRTVKTATNNTAQSQRNRTMQIGINYNQIVRLIGFTSLLIFVTLFTSLFAGMAGYSVLTSIVPPKAPFWQEMRCTLGLPLQGDAKCWQDRISRMEERKAKELSILKGKNKELDQLQAEANARLKSIGTLEDRFDIVNLFTRRKVRGFTVVTGVEYRGLTSGPKWSTAWCYTEVKNHDLALKIVLANATPKGGVVKRKLTSAESSKLGWTSASTLVDQCQWPDTIG